MHRPGVELAIFRSLVRRPTTTLPSQPSTLALLLLTILLLMTNLCQSIKIVPHIARTTLFHTVDTISAFLRKQSHFTYWQNLPQTVQDISAPVVQPLWVSWVLGHADTPKNGKNSTWGVRHTPKKLMGEYQTY